MIVPIVIVTIFAVLAGLAVIGVVGAVRSGRSSEAGQVARVGSRPGAAVGALSHSGQPRAHPRPRAGSRNGDRRRRRDPDLLPAGATVSFDEERKETDIDGVLSSLDSDLVGLVPIKRKVEQIASLLLVDRARNRFGLTAPRPN